MNTVDRRFRIALSFPGERRPFVSQVAGYLAAQLGGTAILYDTWYEAEFARPNLDTYLQALYHDQSDLIAVFLCADYERKEWCGLEWRALRDLIKRRRSESVMPLRLDDTEIPGLFSIDGYVWIGDRSAEEIAGVILERLAQLPAAEQAPTAQPRPVPARLLRGLIQTIGPQGELEPAAQAHVALAQTGESATADENGIFFLKLASHQTQGRSIQLIVRKDGWVIQHPLDGRLDIPDDLGRVVDLRLLPKGSKRLWTDERIESLIADLAEKYAAAVKATPIGEAANQGLSAPPEFAGLIADWSGRYGFGPAEVQQEIDRWVAQIEEQAGDPFRLGLAAYAKKNFADAFSRGMESGDAYLERLAAARVRERDLLEKALHGYRLAGDAAMARYRFTEALDAYGKGLAAIRRQQSPQWWAQFSVLVGDAHQSLGIRLADADSSCHLAEADDAYRRALTVFTRTELPQDWARATSNLGVVLADQSVRTHGQDTQRLLAEAVSAFREALTLRTRQDLPLDWAETLNNLGMALMRQCTHATGDEATLLAIEAIAAFREALTVYTREAAPQRWAGVQNNLGGALAVQSIRSNDKNGHRLLEEAVTAHRAALTVYTRDGLPRDWALSQYHLGSALFLMGADESPLLPGPHGGGPRGTQLLTEAVTALREALTVYTFSHDATSWGATQVSLLLAYQVLHDASGILTVTEQMLEADPENAEWCRLTRWAPFHADLDPKQVERLVRARRQCPADDLSRWMPPTPWHPE